MANSIEHIWPKEEIEAALKQASWVKSSVPSAADHDARVYEGTSGLWKFIVADFDIEPQGFPPGSRGYDGMATSAIRSTVIHLPRDLAERAVKLARAQAEAS